MFISQFVILVKRILGFYTKANYRWDKGAGYRRYLVREAQVFAQICLDGKKMI
jgi:hypothetical protein